jgi:hypothetical protein
MTIWVKEERIKSKVKKTVSQKMVFSIPLLVEKLVPLAPKLLPKPVPLV